MTTLAKHRITCYSKNFVLTESLLNICDLYNTGHLTYDEYMILLHTLFTANRKEQ